MPWWLPGSDGVVYRAGDGIIRVARRGAAGFEGVRPEVLCPHPKDLAFLELMPDASRLVDLQGAPTPPDSRRVEAVLNWTEELKANLPVSVK